VNRSTEAGGVSPSLLRKPDPGRTAVAGQVVRALVDAGVKNFFGVPGGPISPIYNAILETPGTRVIDSRHEASAAFAAASYHRATGEVAALFVTAGPGMTNVITGIASAHCEGSPLLVLCGDVAWAKDGGIALQDSGPDGLDAERMLEHITRACVRVARPESAVAQTLSALQAAVHPTAPGPAFVILPMHRAAAHSPETMHARASATVMLDPPTEAVVQSAAWLTRASRPLVVIGAGARGHAPIIRQLVDRFGIPFVTTPQAKGVVSEEHPLSLRHGGLAASMWARRYTRKPVDVTLVMGTDLDDCSVGPTPYVGTGGKLIHVDSNANVFHRNHPTTLAVQADLGAFAAALSEYAARGGLSNGGAWAGLQRARDVPPCERGDFASDDSTPMAPQRAIADLQAAAGRDAMFITDIGEHMLFALHYLVAREPNDFHIHLGLGSMGSGIAGAVGLALAKPQRPIVCICGDGGMQMNGMEVLVAAREKLAVVYAVFNDARYNMVHHGMKQIYGRGASWESPPVDFAKWAESMGLVGHRITRPGQITADMLREARGAGAPLILDIRIDREQRIQGGGRDEALQQMSVAPGAGS